MRKEQIGAFGGRVKVRINVADVRNDHVSNSFGPRLWIHYRLDNSGHFIGLVDGRHVGTHRMKFNPERVHLFAIDFGSCNGRSMSARLEFERNRDVWMNVAERTEGRDDYAFAAHSGCHVVEVAGRKAVTSPARTCLILPSDSSTRSAPSLSSPRVTPTKPSSFNDTRTWRSKAYDEFAHHSRIVCSVPPSLCNT